MKFFFTGPARATPTPTTRKAMVRGRVSRAPPRLLDFQKHTPENQTQHCHVLRAMLVSNSIITLRQDFYTSNEKYQNIYLIHYTKFKIDYLKSEASMAKYLDQVA